MNAREASALWARADGHHRTVLLAALAGLQVGQRLRVADAFTRPTGIEPTEPDSEGGETDVQRATAPALVEYVSTQLRGAGVDPQTREVELSFSSEAPYERWWGVEVLGHGPGEIDMSWIASGRAPFLSDHDRCEQIGVITRAWLGNDAKGRAVCRFGKSDEAEEEMQDAIDGVRCNVSVGYEIRELELVKQEGDLKTYRVTDWMPLEVSLVSIPADMTVGVGRSATTTTPTVPAQPRNPTEHTMTATTLEKPDTGDAAARKAAETIQRLAETYGDYLKPADVARAMAAGPDGPQQLNELIFKNMASPASDVTTTTSLGLSKKEVKEYSFLRAIQSQIPGHEAATGFERDVSRAIAKAVGNDPTGIYIPSDAFAGKRDFTAGTTGEAGNLIQTDVMGSMFTDVLRPALVMGALGITILPGLKRNTAIPRKTVAGTLAMLTEVATAAETQPGTTLVTLTPHRISAFTQPSKQAIIQSEVGVEAMIRDDLITGAAVLIENQGINGSASGANCRGIRNVSGIGSVVGGTNGANLVWSHITGLEAACANANAVMTDRSGYLLNTKAVNTTKNTQKATYLQFIWENGDKPLNGYRAAVTNNVPSNLTKGTSSGVCSSVVFSSDWSMFVLALFGGLDVTVDPYTLAANGQIQITLNQFIDWACRQPGAFASMDDALTP